MRVAGLRATAFGKRAGLGCGVQSGASALDRAGRSVIANTQLAGDLRTALELDLAVADVAGHPAAGMDRQTPAHREVAVVDAADLGLLDLAAAGEVARRLDLEHPCRLQGHFDLTLHDQTIAGGDLTLHLNAFADDQPLAAVRDLGRRRHRRAAGDRGRRRRWRRQWLDRRDAFARRRCRLPLLAVLAVLRTLSILLEKHGPTSLRLKLGPPRRADPSFGPYGKGGVNPDRRIATAGLVGHMPRHVAHSSTL